MHHVIIGASLPFLIGSIIYLHHGGRASLRLLIIMPASMALGAMWAVIPDIPRLLGFHSVYMRMADDPRINLFFWHYTLDEVEHLYFEPLAPMFNAVFAMLVMAVLMMAWQELFQSEKESQSTPKRR